MERWNAIGFDADMFNALPDNTEIRVRVDKKDVYAISKEDAQDVKIVNTFEEYGKQYFVKLEAFTKK